MAAVAEREVVIGRDTYVVRYEYDPGGLVTIPLTYPLGRPHHEGAKINIYKKKGENRRHVSGWIGVYVEGRHCFEDDPRKLVEWALSKKRKK